MKHLLKEISLLAIKQNSEILPQEKITSNWLGTSPASEEEIKLTEIRLGVELPEDYKELLLITNGFFTPNDAVEPTFEKLIDIDYLKNIEPFIIDIWSKGALINVGKQLARAIVVGGLNDEQFFLLIPPNQAEKKWQYWKFAAWIPGEKHYENLNIYFNTVLQFLKSQSTN